MSDDLPVEGAPSDNTTLSAVIDHYRDDGFDGDFWAEPDAMVRCSACSSAVAAATLEAHSIRRLEGASDPADMVAVVATTCPLCGSTGTLVVAFGPMASGTDADVFAVLRDARGDDAAPPSSAAAEGGPAADEGGGHGARPHA